MGHDRRRSKRPRRIAQNAKMMRSAFRRVHGARHVAAVFAMTLIPLCGSAHAQVQRWVGTLSSDDGAVTHVQLRVLVSGVLVSRLGIPRHNSFSVGGMYRCRPRRKNRAPCSRRRAKVRGGFDEGPVGQPPTGMAAVETQVEFRNGVICHLDGTLVLPMDASAGNAPVKSEMRGRYTCVPSASTLADDGTFIVVRRSD